MIKTIVTVLLIAGFSMFGLAQSHYPGQHTDKLKIAESIDFKAEAFNMSEVKLTNSRFTENMQRDSKWILSLGVDRLLHSFRTNAGVWAGLEGGYDTVDKLGGWESLDCELRGHTTGHILSGLAMLYGSTENDIYKIKADSIITGLAEVQKALGQSGYLSAFPENLIDRVIDGKRVWAPWYTLHKLYAGLIDQYLYCNNEQALKIVSKMGDWAYNKLFVLSEEQRTTMLRNEFGGINDSFYCLYQITGKNEYKWLAEFFYHNATLDPLKDKVDNLSNKHANTFIPKLIGVVRGFEIGGNSDYKEIADYFWDTVVNHHSFCSGSNSDKEKFFEPDQTSLHLSGYTGESCNVYNMLKLTRHLFCLDADVKYADYYEKALFNHILGQQDTKTGMVAYFLPMLPGAYKVYSTPDSSFWCCVGTGFENQAKYGEAIYYHTNTDLFVNLFIPSQLYWKEKGVTIIQQTQFPKEGKLTLWVNSEKPTLFTLKLRYPYWANKASVKVNGKKIKISNHPDSYIAINQIWRNGDKVEVEYPMVLKINPTPENPNVVSISYGPVVLAAKMGTEGMEAPAPYSNPNLHNDYYTYNYHIPENLCNELNLNGKKISSWLAPVEEEFKFRGVDSATGKVYEFVPISDLHRERYIMYWKLQ
ncbi:glycoside hydrolase family 127 protein [Geofilum sp. OHC36d9]|uniref:glycoside hydrolase family 127 protein n=1 Tax=Geofilum sp. OHC36d9 TaxID=3458413 RepID=UPI0040349B63